MTCKYLFKKTKFKTKENIINNGDICLNNNSYYHQKITLKDNCNECKLYDEIEIEVKRLRNGIDPNKCKHGKKGKPVTGCSSCGSWVDCDNPKVVANRVKSGVCVNCEHKEIEGI